MGLGDPAKCVYRFIIDQGYINNTHICTILDYAWTGIIHQTELFCSTYVLFMFIQS